VQILCFLTEDMFFRTLQLKVLQTAFVVNSFKNQCDDTVRLVSGRKELDFSVVSKLKNLWNVHRPVQVGRDGQV